MNRFELLVLLLAAPALAPERFPAPLAIGAAVLALAVLVRGLAAVRAGWPLAYWIAVALPLSLWASPLPEVSWPLLSRLLWSLALAFYVARQRASGGRGCALVRAYFAAGAVLTLAGGLAPNERAGVLTLFLPPAVALAVSPWLDGRRRLVWRLELLALAGLFAALLVATRSRGGLLAAACGTGAVLAASGRRGRTLLGAGVVAAAAAAALAGGDRLAELFVFEGSVQGPSAAVVLTGRPAIWYRALHALADFPLTGLGPGAFGATVDTLYPGFEPPIEDAHDLYLETALDLGIPALAAFLVFVGILARRLAAAAAASPRRGFRRALVLGLGGALAAHLLHALVDSVSPGSLGGVAWWFLCGLILSVPVARRRPRSPAPARALAAAASVLLALAAAWLARPNLAAVAAARVLVSGGGGELAAARLAAAGTCRSRWLLGLLGRQEGRARQRDAAWSGLVRCSPWHFELLRSVAGEDRRLATLAAETWPERAAAHFWLGHALATAGRDAAAAAAYRRGLALEPSAARAWLELGNLVAGKDPEAALAAYGQACRRGDPGANACVRAGATAERLGDVAAALDWYRASRWEVARARADELERRLGEGQRPR